MKKFDELEKIVKKHFPYAKWDEKRQAWIAVTRPNSKDQWEQPETLVAFDKEASKKFYSYMSSNSWDNEGNIQIGVRKTIFENYMKHISTFESFTNEGGYFKGISKSTADKKKAQMDKQAAMDDDDPEAYKELPGDTKGKKQLKTSKHTKTYHELYGKD